MSAKEEIEKIDAEIAEVQKELKDVRGTDTEVYARIVGYYRAVRNWNKGKAEEFKHRKVFELKDSDPARSFAESVQAPHPEFEEDDEFNEGAISSYELFARKTCPNCPPVKDYMAGVSMTGKIVDVDTEAGLATAARKGVFAAPTVIFYNEDGKEVRRAHNVAELEEIFSAVNA